MRAPGVDCSLSSPASQFLNASLGVEQIGWRDQPFWPQPSAIHVLFNLPNGGLPRPRETFLPDLPAQVSLLHHGMDEFTKPKLDRSGGRQRTPVVVPVLQPASQVGKEVTGEAV